MRTRKSEIPSPEGEGLVPSHRKTGRPSPLGCGLPARTKPWLVLALATIASAASAADAPGGAESRPAPVIRRLQLVTVTDTTALFTWETTTPSDAVVEYGPAGGPLNQHASSGGKPGRFHCCEVRGLRPGAEYDYVCRSGPARAAENGTLPGRFRTLVPPPGEELFSFATMTDLHVGQQRVGRMSLNGKVVSEGVCWREPGVPFWQLAIGASIDGINARKPAFTVIKGDIVDGGGAEQCLTARRLLDRLAAPYHVVRGNHDPLNPWLRAFGLSRAWYGFDHKGVHFVVLDTEPLAASKDPALDRQLDWLADDLRKHRDAWTFVFVHRPIPPKLTRSEGGAISEELLYLGEGLLRDMFGSGAVGAMNKATGRTPNVNEDHARRLARLLREHGRVAGVFAGHLHRNYVGRWPEETGNLPFVETASTKEYPCGYAITRVFTGGYMQNYYTPHDPRCLEWSAMTQDAFARLGWQSKAGSLAERSLVVRFDMLRLSPSTTRAASRVRSGK